MGLMPTPVQMKGLDINLNCKPNPHSSTLKKTVKKLSLIPRHMAHKSNCMLHITHILQLIEFVL